MPKFNVTTRAVQIDLIEIEATDAHQAQEMALAGEFDDAAVLDSSYEQPIEISTVIEVTNDNQEGDQPQEEAAIS